MALMTLVAEQDKRGGHMRVTSSAFEAGMPIPKKYTCSGEDISPDLHWSNVPNGTKSIALICEDPDAPSGTFVHWVLYDLPGTATDLPAAQPKGENLSTGAKQGRNDFRKVGYAGPCPPAGKPHRYFFKVYALDDATRLHAGAKKAELLAAIKGHVLAEGELVGTAKR